MLAPLLVLLATWLVLSGHFYWWLVAAGIGSTALVVYLAWRLRILGEGPFPLSLPRFSLGYCPWLAWQVARASLDVAYRVWHPKLPIQPRLVRLDHDLKTTAGLATWANSITLTPGTVTVEAGPDEVLVHALTESGEDELRSGGMLDRVGRLENDTASERS
ncbi:MAG: Na+/H+ antiporter subunit E [Acidobacteriota bacterium]